MPLDYDGIQKMNQDVSANALEHASKAMAAVSYADEWKDEVRIMSTCLFFPHCVPRQPSPSQ